jgi:ribosome modulation factor
MDRSSLAMHWGIKAAVAGLPESSNPYRSPNERNAWLRGYNSILDSESCRDERPRVKVLA